VTAWTQGDNVNLAVGQGDVQVTPLQLARAYAALANGGTLVTPHLGGRIEIGQEITSRGSARGRAPLHISRLTRSTILSGLRRPRWSQGTSYSVFGGFPFSIAGRRRRSAGEPRSVLVARLRPRLAEDRRRGDGQAGWLRGRIRGAGGLILERYFQISRPLGCLGLLSTRNDGAAKPHVRPASLEGRRAPQLAVHGRRHINASIRADRVQLFTLATATAGAGQPLTRVRQEALRNRRDRSVIVVAARLCPAPRPQGDDLHVMVASIVLVLLAGAAVRAHTAGSSSLLPLPAIELAKVLLRLALRLRLRRARLDVRHTLALLGLGLAPAALVFSARPGNGDRAAV
jgi:hypothetical protein